MENKSLDLWYKQGGKTWFDAMPIGGGRIGGMVYGGVGEDRIDLSESTCYSGRIEPTNNPKAKENFPKAKEAMLKRDYKTAVKYAENVTGSRANYGTNLPLGSIRFAFEHKAESVQEYCRGLSFKTAKAVASYTHEGTQFKRECFASNPDEIIAVQFTASEGGKLSFKAYFDGGENPHETRAVGDCLILHGNAFETRHTKDRCGVAYCEKAKFVAEGGEICAENTCLNVKNADKVTVYIAIRSDFLKPNPEAQCDVDIASAVAKSYDELLKKHVEDFAKYFSRVELELSGEDFSDLPTDVRIANVKENSVEDVTLLATMFQYARYMLISSSRENSPLPTHLQGVWNDNVACRIGWTCDMHLDINTQMNYWHAHSTNLAECTKPLSAWVHDILLPSGKISAKESYDCDGFVAHTVSNPWGFTAPGAAVYWGFHVTGGAWIATHLWLYYAYTLDEKFLRATAYPVLKESCVFFEQYLTKDPKTGYYVTPLSHSPENNYFIDGEQYSVAVMPTCDIAILTELFENFLNAQKILGGDEELAKKVEFLKANMPPYEVGSDGRLKEWLEEFPECQPNHRHTTHMLGLHPFSSITPNKTPELVSACQKTMDARMTPYESWEDTGWARSMLMAYSARMWKGDDAWFHLREMMRLITQKNLFVIHPPTAGADSDVYELDGNTGLASCVAEMLLQSYDGVIHLLPALPSAWQTGHVTGLKAKGDHTVDIYFADGKLQKAQIRTKPNIKVKMLYSGKECEKVADENGVVVIICN